MKLIINNKTFDYSPETLDYATATAINIEDATENLILFKKIADKYSFNFLLYYGTLLGAVREKNFIEYDIDIDIVTNDEEGFLSIIPELQLNGFRFIRYENTPCLHSYTTLYSIRRKSVYIDIYIAYKEGNKYNLLGSYIKKQFIEDTHMYTFLNQQFKIPKDYITVLEILYGKNWKIPIKNSPGDFPKSTLLKTKIKRILRKIIPQKIKKILKKIIYINTSNNIGNINQR